MSVPSPEPHGPGRGTVNRGGDHHPTIASAIFYSKSHAIWDVFSTALVVSEKISFFHLLILSKNR
jgi:hypothetical protein